MNDENKSEELLDERGDYDEPAGFDALLYSLANALEAKPSKEAIALLIKNYAEDLRAQRKRLAWMTIASWGMTLLIIGALGTLAYLKLISVETTAALIGIVIGSLYRQQSR